MSGISKIEWTEKTWNPVRGCSRVSEGCENCYAEKMAHRFSGPGGPYEELTISTSKGPRWSGKMMVVEKDIEKPMKWKKPLMIFVNSMSDLFHQRISNDDILRIFDVMNTCEHHIFQVLTKRPERVLKLDSKIKWTKNIWMGVSVESEKYIDRIDELRETSALIKFLSLEPLLGPLKHLNLDGIDWAIVGGESGPGARDMEKIWVRDLRDQCNTSKVSFFFKQWGGRNKKKTGRVLDGKTYDDFPIKFQS